MKKSRFKWLIPFFLMGVLVLFQSCNKECKKCQDDLKKVQEDLKKCESQGNISGIKSLQSNRGINESVVFRGGILVVNNPHQESTERTITSQERDKIIANYWGGDIKNERRIFPITENVLRDLFQQGDLPKKDSVVIKVTSMETPANVKAEWLPYDNDFRNATWNTDGAQYYVLDSAMVFRKVSANKHESNGIIHASQEGSSVTVGTGNAYPMKANTISARFAKNNGKFHIVVNPVFMYIISKHGGTGSSHGSTGGIKIPPQ